MDEKKIYASSHAHWYVIDKRNNSILKHGNFNSAVIGLSYSMASFDFKPEDLVEEDMKSDASKHLRKFVRQLKAAGFAKEHYENLVVVKGIVNVEIFPKGKQHG